MEPHPHSSRLGAPRGQGPEPAVPGALLPAPSTSPCPCQYRTPNHLCPQWARWELSVQDHKPSSALAREGRASQLTPLSLQPPDTSLPFPSRSLDAPMVPDTDI
ncbi:Hypothetical predicted protein [Marmota monax]|uniref:Uncharacterized protein n=1 Tax=Marmota monax TaxID=9995 RepID=A0A5E4AMZ2_MARMO|nr:hypothetical protein GHT09_017469 [Marmota monax]VTJ57852.1 Hypothetical predicted protein [Marmota monax]